MAQQGSPRDLKIAYAFVDGKSPLAIALADSNQQRPPTVAGFVGAGHDQAEGALTKVVVVSATFGLLAFWVWFHIIEEAFVIPFMPTQ